MKEEKGSALEGEVSGAPAHSPEEGARVGGGICKIIKKNEEILEIKIFNEELYDTLYEFFHDVLCHADVDPDDETHLASFRVDINDKKVYFDLHKNSMSW